jgi:hypothetical protein
LDEVSRADPAQQKMIFQRLAEEAKRDEQRASRRAQEQPARFKQQAPGALPSDIHEHAWGVDVPESPSGTWRSRDPVVSEDVVAGWVAEDAESERKLREKRAWKLRLGL